MVHVSLLQRIDFEVFNQADQEQAVYVTRNNDYEQQLSIVHVPDLRDVRNHTV